VMGAARSAPAERLARLSSSAFGDDGVAAAAPVAAEARKSGGLFRRRR